MILRSGGGRPFFHRLLLGERPIVNHLMCGWVVRNHHLEVLELQLADEALVVIAMLRESHGEQCQDTLIALNTSAKIPRLHLRPTSKHL